MSASDILHEAAVESVAGTEAVDRLKLFFQTYAVTLDQSTQRLRNTTASRQLVLREALVVAGALDRLIDGIKTELPGVSRTRRAFALSVEAASHIKPHDLEEQESILELIGSLGRLLGAINESVTQLAHLLHQVKQMPGTTRQLRIAKDRTIQALGLLQKEHSDAVEMGSQAIAALQGSLAD